MGAVECYKPRENEMTVVSLNSLPLGFRFRPTDEELIDYYLRQKINGNGDEVWVIREIDVCKCEPWDLPDLSVVRNKDPEWFFFCPQDRKYPNGHRLNRATRHGYWKATGKDRKIKSGLSLIGMKKTLVFYTGRAPKGKRTNWVMHEYRPTLKELDGTNPGQNPYVLCRLFKKQDESLEGSNGDEVERTDSTPTTAIYSPEEIQSDPTLVAVSPSQATEDDKRLAVIAENSEETISNNITSVDCHSDGCDTYDALNQTAEPAAKEYQPLEIFYDPTTEQLDDKLFSPVHVHIPTEFYYQANTESDGLCGLQLQYGTNETNIPDFYNSVVNWDQFCEEYISQKLNYTLFNGSGSGSDMDMANMTHLQPLHAVYPEEATDRRIPLVTNPEFCSTITSDLSGDEQKINAGLFQNNFQMPSLSDVSMGQVYNVVNDYEQPRNFNTVVSSDTGIRIRPRRNEQPNINPVTQLQGTAPRRLCLLMQPLVTNEKEKEGSCTREDENSKSTIDGERKASGNHADDDSASSTNDVDEPKKTTSFESADTRKISQHVANAGSISGFKEFLLQRRLRYASKATSNRTIWPSVLAVSAVALLSLGFFANIWGYLKF